ncbi:hypothetical protein IFM89_000841 [Coptis chinensis]|uniref:RING-type E3 ubiquitin transferase n=1 Tax=Coptis chinensis TaxID=261450 RepID=A0A835IVC7_9MAGN|nr:hypothetical protein IFM89_000841 [Coptis chinensis]
MGSGGKKRWKFSFHRTPSSNTSKPETEQAPKEFICSISGSMMADPVIVTSGQTFEGNCVHVCKNLGFTPLLSDGTRPDLTSLIPNIAFKSTILNWCDTHRVDRPVPIAVNVAEKLVMDLMEVQKERVVIKDKEFVKSVTELTRSHFYSSSEESVITTPLPFSTRPACYSSSSSISSSEIVSSDESCSEEEEIVMKLKSTQVFEQEEGVVSLRKLTRMREELRVLLCTPRLLSALRSLMVSRYVVVQVNSVAALVNISLEKSNKVKIVRCGIVPVLIDVLKGGFNEAQEHAAGALFSLALDDDNKMAIGVLGALEPLVHMLRCDSERARNDSALALYHLSLVNSNRVKLVKLGAVSVLLSLVKVGELASRALLILCNLAVCDEGRSVMLDENAVECFFGMLKDGDLKSASSVRENCVAALYSLSLGSLRFKSLAKDAGAREVLVEVAEKGSDRAKEKAKKMLLMLKERTGREGDEEIDWESVMNSGVVSRIHQYRLGVGDCANSTGF